MRYFGQSPRKNLSRRYGFTLIEVAITMVIIGMGVMGVVRLMAACTVQNREAANATTALFLANNVQEAIADLPFSDPSGAATFGLEETGQPLTLWDDIDDFNGYIANPPIDATRNPIAALSKYSQEVSVQRVDPQKLSLAVSGADAARVTVRILYKNLDGSSTELHTLTWLRVKR